MYAVGSASPKKFSTMIGAVAGRIPSPTRPPPLSLLLTMPLLIMLPVSRSLAPSTVVPVDDGGTVDDALSVDCDLANACTTITWLANMDETMASVTLTLSKLQINDIMLERRTRLAFPARVVLIVSPNHTSLMLEAFPKQERSITTTSH